MNEACGVVVGTIAVGRGPIGGMTLSADGRRLLVTNYGDDSVSVIDTEADAVVHTVSGVGEPFGIAAAAPGAGIRADRAYVGAVSPATDSVVAIDMDTADIVATHPVAFHVSDLAVDPTGQHLYVARTAASGADVMVIDTGQGPVATTELSTAPGATAGCVRVGPDGRRLYIVVRLSDGDAVTVLDPDLKLVNAIEAGSTIRDIAVHPDNRTVFIARCDSVLGGVVDIVDTTTAGDIGAAGTTGHAAVGRFEVSDAPTQLTVSGDGERVYVLTDGGVVVMCALTHRLIGTIPADSPPSCLAESPDGNRLYLADYTGTVTLVLVATESSQHLDQELFDDSIARLLELEPAV